VENAVRQSRPGEGPPALLRLYLLGRFEAVRADAPIPSHAWRRRRPADLLKLVALSPGRSLSREEAIGALWPDKDPASGANNLHRALYDLRQILGGRWVDIDRGRLRLRSDAWVDVEAFERAASEGGRDGFTRAVALYRGDLAVDEEAGGGSEAAGARGLRARRAALRARFVEAALPLARAAAAEGDAQLSASLLRRVLELDATQEDAHRLLIRLLAEGGRRADALGQCHACDSALRAAGLAPSDETRQLRAAIEAGEIGPARCRAPQDGALRAARRLLGTGDPPPVRGRGPLLLLLESLVEQGAGTLVLLGESGAGKTRLALEGARLAQGHGAAVLCGIAGTSPGVPYALFQDALREEARANPSVPDPFPAEPAGVVAGEDVRRAIFEGVEQALRTVADGRPLFVLLDDVHLADESSLNLFHLLARRAPALRLMMVATCGEDAIHAGTPIQTALAHLDCRRLARGLHVPRLGLAGTREQVRDLLGETVDEPTLARIHRLTDGSPFLVEVVARAWRGSGGAAVPADAASAIRERVARLGGGAEALLAAAAVAGARFELEPVRLVSGLPVPEAVAALEGCLAARLVEGDGAGYRFHHALVREAVYAGLAGERRRTLHAAMADVLEAAAGSEPPPEALAHHRRRAGQGDRAVRHLARAGHRAASRAGLGEALAFYTEALELLGAREGSARLELLDAAGRAQLGLGEVDGAARAFQQAARLALEDGLRPEPALRVEAHRLAALALAAGGHLRAAHAELDEGLRVAEDARAGEERARLLCLRAEILWHEGRHPEAREAAASCAAGAADAGDGDLVARGRDLAALARAAMGAPLAPPEPEPAPPPRPRRGARSDEGADVHLLLWDRDLVAGDCPAVARLAALHAERARMRGAPASVAVGRLGEGAAALAMGDLEAADAALREALEGHRAAGSALGEALTLERLAALFTIRGRLDEALEFLEAGILVAERAALRRHALVRLHATEARNRLAAGAVYAAEDALRVASETAVRHGECVSCDAAFRPEAVRVLLARGRIGEADREAAQLEDLAARRGGRVLGAFAATARARVLGAMGDRAAALDALAGACVAFLDAGHRVEAARCALLERRLARPSAATPDEVLALEGLSSVCSGSDA
jgi:DNA-binding SARP family transcriptional activator/tetratricopeptide (TPR) repeat protein